MFRPSNVYTSAGKILATASASWAAAGSILAFNKLNSLKAQLFEFSLTHGNSVKTVKLDQYLTITITQKTRLTQVVRLL